MHSSKNSVVTEEAVKIFSIAIQMSSGAAAEEEEEEPEEKPKCKSKRPVLSCAMVSGGR
jgi:hypothetical protein